MLRHVLVCVLLAVSCHGNALPASDPANQFAPQTNPSTADQATHDKVIKVPGTCGPDGSCTCNIPPSSAEEYLQLKEVKQQLNQLDSKLSTMTISHVRQTLNDVIKRTDLLEAHLDQQSVSSSVKEISEIRGSLSSIEKTLKHVNSSSDADLVKMRKDLAVLDEAIQKMWSQNPHAKADDLKEQIEDLRQQLGDHDGNYRGSTQKEMQDFCESHELASIGDSYVHQWLQEFRIGSWFMDPYAETDEQKAHIWHRSFEHSAWFFRYQKYVDFIEKKNQDKPFHAKIHGTGFVGYNGSVYYHYTSKLYRHVVSTGEKTVVDFKVKDTKYLNTYVDTFVDLKVDEYGLWAIYVASSGNADRLSISKINPETLAIEKTWHTNQHKISICATFMACGRMYTIDNCEGRLPPGPHHKQFVYDTATGKEYMLPYYVTAKFGHIWHTHYNPDPKFPLAELGNHNLFGWDNGHVVSFGMRWKKI